MSSVQSPSTFDIRFAMTSFPGFSASTTMLHTNDTATTAATTTAAAVTSEVDDWSTSVVNVTSSSMTGRLSSSSASEWPWSSWTATAVAELNVTTELSSSTSTNSLGEVAADSSSSSVDVAYQRLKNLGIIVGVYAVVLVAMIMIACRRRRFGVDYRPADDWTDLDVCSGGNDDDDVDDSAAFQRYWDTRRNLAERQRLLDSLRVDNISSVAAGHLIDRLPEHVV